MGAPGGLMGLFLLAAWSLWKNTSRGGSVALGPDIRKAPRTAGRKHSPLQQYPVRDLRRLPLRRGSSLEREGKS